MKKISFTIILFLSVQIYAQIKFESGYLIDNFGVRKSFFIKNMDWAKNPEEFEYKITENGEIQKGNLLNVNEFGTDEGNKYIKMVFDFDKSTEIVSQISSTSAPELIKKTGFLKVLVEGKINLYVYNSNFGTAKYYISKEGGKPEALIYKKYRVSESLFKENIMFRNQIWNMVNDSDIKLREVENLNYNYNDLSKIILKYNQNNGSLLTDNTNKSKSILNLYAKTGVNLSSFEISNSLVNSKNQFDNSTTIYIGIEAEFILGVNKNKWAIIVDPTYSSFRGKVTNANGDLEAEMNYSSFDLPLGIRYNMFLNENSRLFINTFFMFDFPLKLEATYKTNFGLINDNGLKWQGSTTDYEPIFGLGYNYKNKLSAEVRYCFNNDLLNRLRFYDTQYSTVSIIFGYRIFQSNKRK
jgi:hypothetical protein